MILRTLVGQPVNWLPCFGPNGGPYLIWYINGLPRYGPKSGPMRSDPLKAYNILGQIMAQIRSGPLRGFGLNYGPYQIRPINWTL